MLSSLFAGFFEGNSLPRFHLSDSFRDGLAISLPSQGVHRLTMGFRIHNNVGAIVTGINDFQ